MTMAKDVLFDIDASEILAKLHLAAKQQANVKSPNFIFNTGIINDSDSATPEKPENVKFNLKNPTNLYYVGYVTEFEYKQSFDIRNKLNDLEKAQAKIASSKIDITDAANNEKYKEIENSVKYLSTALNVPEDEIKNALGGKNDKGEKDSDSYNKWKEEILKNLQTKENDEKKEYDAAREAELKKAIQVLNTYMENFSGKENIEKSIDESSVGMIFVSRDVKDANDKKLVDSFEIQKISDTENEKLQSEFRANYVKDPSKNNCKVKVCFNVAYQLNVDK